ncbi:MAG TPA: DNA-binding response regulator [Microscillaceae bacterium]|nr:DNA-binding response regulator [Microscillaceae bacterium]
MKAIIVDDNQKARKSLTEQIQRYCPNLELLGSASNIKEGKVFIEQTRPDLVFLDIEMPNGTGFDLLRQLPVVDFKVIFTTAHEKYALTAIKFSALDYLLKPIDLEELLLAVDKAKETTKENTGEEVSQLQIQTLLQNLHAPPTQQQKILLNDPYGVQVIFIDDIIRLKAENNYTQFFVKNQKPLLISKPLKDYEKILPAQKFFRCHKSHLVNLSYLQRYDRREDDVLIFQDGSKVPVSRRKVDVLLERIKLG